LHKAYEISGYVTYFKGIHEVAKYGRNPEGFVVYNRGDTRRIIKKLYG
jgi:hypothetical protein